MSDDVPTLQKLCLAARDGDCATVARLLDEGADVNTDILDGATPLHWASVRGRTDVVRALLAHPRIDVNARDDCGWTPLHFAVRYEPAVVTQLLAHPDIDANVTDDCGDTPLHWTASIGRPDIAELLLARGADPDAKNKNARTPLHAAKKCARHSGHTQVAQLLRDYPRSSP